MTAATWLVLVLTLDFAAGAAAEPPRELHLTEIAPGVFSLGKVTLNKARRAVSFPAVLNQRDGVVEYAVVTFTGKTHESVFKTEASPEHIHTALLLLGVTPADTNVLPLDPSVALPGEKVAIEVSWRQDGREIRRPLEHFIVTTNDQKSLSPGPWIYNGSYLMDHRFMAQMDGSIISIHTDPVALVNNPRKGRENDDLQHVNTPVLPPSGVVVQVEIKLQDQTSPGSRRKPARPPGR